MPATTAAPAASQIHQLQFSRGATAMLLKDIPADQRCAQPGPCVNHVMWILGHLACTDDFFLKEFAGAKALALPEDWHKLFGYGSKPTCDAKAYPPFEMVSKAFDERRAAFIKWHEGLSAAELEQAGPADWQKYAPTLGDVAGFAAYHEGYHGGQLSALRRAFGLSPAFG